MHNQVQWENPYFKRHAKWLRGNLHLHTKEKSGCASSPLADMLSIYADNGYDFVAISDHMAYRRVSHPQLTVLPGLEWNSPHGEHAGVYSLDEKVIKEALSIRDQQILLHEMEAKKALIVLNHPNWQEPPHYSREQLSEKRFFAGIEIYNAAIEILEGQALATEKWDFLLSRNQRALGLASDDSHHTSHSSTGWLMVRAASRDARDIFRSLSEGNFYSSTGVTFTEIRRDGSVITILSPDADEIHAIGDNGRRLALLEGGFMEFDLAKCRTSYVRFTAYGRGSQMAWTQPFFAGLEKRDKWRSHFVCEWKMSPLIAFSKRDIRSAPFVAPERRRKWPNVSCSENHPGFMNAHHFFGDADGIVYFSSAFKVDRKGIWKVLLGYDGGITFFVDGKRVFSDPITRNPAMPGRSAVDVSLEAGTHDFLLALDTDHGMGWGFFMQFEVPEDERTRLARPFFPRPISL